MIKEDYISFEIAKLLKEKWFKFIEDDRDELSQAYIHAYTKDGKEVWGCYDSDYCPCITLNVAMKWLREVHKLVITVSILNEHNKGNTDYSNPDRWFYFFDITNEKGVIIDIEYDPLSNEFLTYEEACEAAIKYCLENLI